MDATPIGPTEPTPKGHMQILNNVIPALRSPEPGVLLPKIDGVVDALSRITEISRLSFLDMLVNVRRQTEGDIISSLRSNLNLIASGDEIESYKRSESEELVSSLREQLRRLEYIHTLSLAIFEDKQSQSSEGMSGGLGNKAIAMRYPISAYRSAATAAIGLYSLELAAEQPASDEWKKSINDILLARKLSEPFEKELLRWSREVTASIFRINQAPRTAGAWIAAVAPVLQRFTPKVVFDLNSAVLSGASNTLHAVPRGGNSREILELTVEENGQPISLSQIENLSFLITFIIERHLKSLVGQASMELLGIDANNLALIGQRDDRDWLIAAHAVRGPQSLFSKLLSDHTNKFMQRISQ